MKILNIQDTREYYIEQTAKGEKKVYIPGTGIKNECDSCGAEHEIHALIQDDSGAVLNVGVGCLKKIAGGKELLKQYEAEQELKKYDFEIKPVLIDVAGFMAGYGYELIIDPTIQGKNRKLAIFKNQWGLPYFYLKINLNDNIWEVNEKNRLKPIEEFFRRVKVSDKKAFKKIYEHFINFALANLDRAQYEMQ